MQPSEQDVREIYRQGEDACVTLIMSLFERIESLESKVGTGSNNSSIPPSQDPFRPKNKKKRARRARNYHSQGGRKLAALEDVDAFVDIYPQRGRRCSLPLSSVSPQASAPTRHQQVELPEPAAILTEYRLHALHCRGCGEDARDGPAAGGSAFDPFFGSGTTALVAIKNGRRAVGIEINPEFCALALERLRIS
jgi:hypothetical protein